MTDDPRPWFRCRCVHRQRGPDHPRTAADPYYDRGHQRPDGEDGLCAHCRQPEGRCADCDPDRRACCLHPSQRRRLVDLAEACADRQTAPF